MTSRNKDQSNILLFFTKQWYTTQGSLVHAIVMNPGISCLLTEASLFLECITDNAGQITLRVFSANSDPENYTSSIVWFCSFRVLGFQMTDRGNRMWEDIWGVWPSLLHNFCAAPWPNKLEEPVNVSVHGSFSYKCQATLCCYLYYLTLASKEKLASDTAHLVLKGHQSLPPTCHKSSV